MKGASRRPLLGYLLGLALVAVGAGLMEWLDSWLPLALTGSAAILLTVPLVQQIAARRRTAPTRKR